MTFQELKQLVTDQFPEAMLGEDLNATPQALLVAPEAIHAVCTWLHAGEKTYFDSLSCLTGLDNGPEAGTMEVIYNLYSIPYDLHLMLKVSLERANPHIDTVSDIWKTANWHEREAYDLLGIHFNNHPDLRRILLPKDWEGHPLRKDYEEQEKYHGMTVKYDRKEAPN
ncbi:NADH-quinone oxidoreductase subunit C [Marinoscillum sp. 108]|uniref:NADH-quinone oxidoreductase subunit C n=1 Tax=Marinoscillum sp. 108 TaxID=2653151 RepID=UPI0012F0B90B|nr:NADH-quinone oxidoreductase subunit C [Marinoscillum sp. 108]VXD20566.1 NADH-quinone oxidoreductase subunit C [Marinoscillum sp. 108]